MGRRDEGYLNAPYTYVIFGDFVVKAITTVGPVLGAVIGAWLHARYGRKVRLKIGELEAEAQTMEELEKLLKRVEELQQRNQSKGDS